MFYYHMSYHEIVQAFEELSEAQQLSKSAWVCFTKSLEDCFVGQMLRSYPLSKKAHRLIARTIAAFRAQNIELLTANVHDVIYSSLRQKTAQWLQVTYGDLSTPDFDSMEALKSLITQAFESYNTQTELELEEESRFFERGSCGEKTSWPSIKSDFEDYLEHLSALQKGGGTYGFPILKNILKRIRTLQNQDYQDAVMALIRSLDDSRTAYHALSTRHIEGKTYSCQKGFEERLLDHHAVFCPASQIEPSVVEKFVEAVAKPFSYTNPETSSVLFSKAFYALYTQAAGYAVGATPSQQWQLKADSDKEILKRKWAQLYPGRQQQLTTTLSLLAHGGVRADLPLEDFILLSMQFLKSENALSIIDAYEPSLQPPKIQKDAHEIDCTLLEIGPFLDESHLFLAYALCPSARKEMQLLAENGYFNDESPFLRPILKHELRTLYEGTYLNAYPNSYPFLCERLEQALMTSDLETLPCSQKILNIWLDEHHIEISAPRYATLAVLCAMEGYSLSLSKIFQYCQSISWKFFKTAEHESLLTLAIKAGHSGCVRVILSHRNSVAEKINTFCVMTMGLLVCCRSMTIDSYNELLLLAATYGDYDCLQEVLKTSPFINAQNERRHSALRLAIKHDNFDCAHALLEHKINPNLQDSLGDTAIIYAIKKKKSLQFIEMLLSYHPNLNLQNDRGSTALIIAVYLNEPAYMEALLKHHPDVNIQNKMGLSALIIAAQKNYMECLRMLLQHGANPSLCNKFGKTALSYSIDNNNSEAAALLRKYHIASRIPQPMIFFIEPEDARPSRHSRFQY